jgi:hypothetical protein
MRSTHVCPDNQPHSPNAELAHGGCQPQWELTNGLIQLQSARRAGGDGKVVSHALLTARLYLSSPDALTVTTVYTAYKPVHTPASTHTARGSLPSLNKVMLQQSLTQCRNVVVTVAPYECDTRIGLMPSDSWCCSSTSRLSRV